MLIQRFLKQIGPIPTLVDHTLHELHFCLPNWTVSAEDKCIFHFWLIFSFEGPQLQNLFTQLENPALLEELDVSSYGVKDTTLEEIFLKISNTFATSEGLINLINMLNKFFKHVFLALEEPKMKWSSPGKVSFTPGWSVDDNDDSGMASAAASDQSSIHISSPSLRQTVDNESVVEDQECLSNCKDKQRYY